MAIPSYRSGSGSVRRGNEIAGSATPGNRSLCVNSTVFNVGFDDMVYPVGALSKIVTSLAREGIAETSALEGCHLMPTALHSHETLVSLNQVLQVCRNATRLTRDPHFGYHTGQRFHVSTYGIYGFAIWSSTNFRQGADFAERYYQLATPLVDETFREERQRVIWSFRPIAHPLIDPELFRLLIELQLSILISLHRDGMGSAFIPTEVHLPFGELRDGRQYEHMFGCSVLFDTGDARLIYDSTWLDREACFGNEIAHAEAVKLCDDLMERMELRAGLAGKVRELLLMRRLAPTSCTTAAKQLYMTERTLRRKLSEERTSFRQIVFELRMHIAVRYLRDTALTIQEISNSLGFADDASFRHAFRRWTKASPMEFRDRFKHGIMPLPS